MNADALLACYERIAEAPDAITRMRRFVLDLAVRGKLVAQDPRDEPAAELLKRIARDRVRLVKTGEIKKPREVSAKAMELPFALPLGWTAVPLDQLSPWSLVDGDWIETKDQSQTGNVRLIQLADVGVGKFLDKSARFITEATEVRLNCTRLVPGDVLIARLPNPIGRACLFPNIGQPAITAVDVAILRLDRHADPAFLVLALNAPPTRSQIEAYGKGTTRFRVSTGHLKVVVIPLPPLAEQHRIVAKVHELMVLCDRLESARKGREAARDRLAAASLARLNTPDPESFQDDARFALNALPALTARPDQIKHLRQTILNLAVRGKLVPQDAKDEPASVLLGRIGREIAAFCKANRISGTQVEPISSADRPFAAPVGWEWTRLCSLFNAITDGDHQPPPRADDGVAFLTIGNVTTGRLVFAGCRLVPEAYFRSLAPYRTPTKGDILYTVVGATYGRPALVETDRPFCVQRHIAILKPSEEMSLRFLMTLLASPLIFDQATRSTTGTAQPTIALRPLRNFIVPLPPLAEQHRIIARVDELMALCDRLEASLADTEATRSRLLSVLLTEALTPAEALERNAA